MKTTLLTMSAVAALAAATPAAAQYGSYPSQYDGRYSSQNDGRYSNQYDSRYSNRYGQDVSFSARIDNLDARLAAGMRAGTIDRREGWSLRRQLYQLRQLEARYRMDGFTEAERADLWQRLRTVRQDLRVADNGSYDRYDRMAWDDYNSGASRYTGTGGPYEEVVCERRDGVAGFIDAVTGSQNCYSVGDRIGNGLYDVPFSYRDRYRDGNGVYYRSDGRNIYEIDARTNTVIAIHRTR